MERKEKVEKTKIQEIQDRLEKEAHLERIMGLPAVALFVSLLSMINRSDDSYKELVSILDAHPDVKLYKELSNFLSF